MRSRYRITAKWPSREIVIAALACAMLLPMAAAAAYNRIDAMVQSWATGGDTFYYNFTDLPDPSIWESAFSLGIPDDTGLTNSGWADVRADLADGTLNAFALANNSKVQITLWDGSKVWDWTGGGNVGGAEASVSMADDLYFTVPAGSYAEPVSVRFRGHADYYLSASGLYGARGDFYAAIDPPLAAVQRFWSAEGPEAVTTRWPGPGPQALFNGQIGGTVPFQLGAVLLPAGTTLNTPTLVGLRLDLGLGRGQTILSGMLSTTPETYSYADSDIKLAIDTLYLPAGVSFSSSSGVFLKNVAVVPEPETWALMLAGLGLVSWAARRRG